MADVSWRYAGWDAPESHLVYQGTAALSVRSLVDLGPKGRWCGDEAQLARLPRCPECVASLVLAGATP